MSLSPSEEQQARSQAENRYAAAHPEVTSSEGMESNPDFIRMHHEAIAAIEASHVTPPTPSSSRSDTVIVPCPYSQEALTTHNCNFTRLQVNKSSDTNRVYRSGSGQPTTIEIVAGRINAKATMELRLSGVSIACDTHNQRVWNVSPLLAGTNLSNNATLDMNLGWTGNVEQLGFFNHRISPTRYQVRASTHNKSESITINVYPDYAWEGTASVSFRLEEGTRRVLYDGLNIQLSRTDDNQTTQYGGRIQEIVDLIGRFLGFIFLVKQIAETVTSGAFTWSIVPPTFAITLGSKWQENTTNLRCGYYYNLRLAFNPLVGIQLVVNLGIIAIQAIPYIGALVARMAGSEITRYIAITFTLSGTLGVDVTASKSAERDSGTLNGGVTGQIGFDLSIRGQVNRDFGIFAINCGLGGGARATVTATLRGPLIDTSGSYASLGANFDGLTLYVRMYCRAGSSQTTRQTTATQGATGGHTGPDGQYEVRDGSRTTTGDTSREQAGANDEHSYLWIAARPLGEHRINL